MIRALIRKVVREELQALRREQRPDHDRIDRARRNAAWWRNEIKAGRVKATNDIEWLLRDLEAVSK